MLSGDCRAAFAQSRALAFCESGSEFAEFTFFLENARAVWEHRGMNHTISALVENKFGVLARVAGMFSGRGFNIETLNVGPVNGGKYSRITATVEDGRNSVEQCVKQLNKFVNVIDVKDFSKLESFVARELVLVQVKADRKTRPEIVQVADLFRAKVIDVDSESLIIECTGNANKIKGFMGMIEPFGIIDMARTGSVALSRGSYKPEEK